MSGGSWSDGDKHGHYRVLVISEGWEEVRHRTFLQWVAESGTRESADAVQASQDLTAVAEMYGLAEPTFSTRAGRWYVNVRGARRPMSAYTYRLKFELGLPGHVRRVASK